MIRRFASATAATAGLALSLTGCLGDAGKEVGENAAKGVRLTAAQVLGRTADRAAKADTFTADMTIDSSAPQAPLKMHVLAQTRLRPEAAMRMTVGSSEVAGNRIPGYEARLVGDAMYMRMPALRKATGGKPWAKLSLKQAGGASGIDLGKLMDQAEQQSPATQTRMLTASKDVRKVGTENVGGVPTTHYAGTMSPREALAKVDANTRTTLEKTYGQLGATAIRFDVWVGADDLPRKHVSVVPLSGGQTTTTVLYRDYGRPVTVQAPPASQTGALKMPKLGS
ncbi:hypothetical protein [Actinomadura parmotrematis]|uniref:LppX_LprAFG lipoprotein n=1 Tax=Actinomadura parmotrematis TaxID=2864039 RepID=A0ABS7FYX4_9ACTN|nr:hypothetical protein [Actinomadura parmotrematis]MBW8485145.1 hypothetical protein [Actinomadura parmotrematis]